MAELYEMSAKTAGFNYTISPVIFVATTAVAVNSTTNRPPFDFGISFNTVTPDRILTVDFSHRRIRLRITRKLEPVSSH